MSPDLLVHGQREHAGLYLLLGPKQPIHHVVFAAEQRLRPSLCSVLNGASYSSAGRLRSEGWFSRPSKRYSQCRAASRAKRAWKQAARGSPWIWPSARVAAAAMSLKRLGRKAKLVMESSPG